MKTTWSIKEEILKRANFEADVNWSKQENPQLPKYQPVKIEREKVGWLNFALTTLKELKP